jgi:uncharacterized protein YbjT (DUF2867 family)
MRILITGANGLVGQGVLQECLRDPKVTEIVALGRHPSGQSHRKLGELICPDFSRLRAVEEKLQPFDACLYCAGAPPIGTSEIEYRHVTQELTENVARTMARHNPGMTFVYVSGAHANAHSRLMPLRVKGETEEALAALPIRTVMLRPGGIQPVEGVRSPHAAMAALYSFAGPLMGWGVQLLPGTMTTTQRVGRAILAVLQQPDVPAVLENRDINRLGT